MLVSPTLARICRTCLSVAGSRQKGIFCASHMVRIALVVLTLFGAIAALAAAVLLPVHLCALDPRILALSRQDGKSLIQITEETARRAPAVAKIFLLAAEDLTLEGTEEVLGVLRERANQPARTTLLQELENASRRTAIVQETTVLTALRPRPH